MSGRDHSTTCPDCGYQRGGLSDMDCECPLATIPGGWPALRREVEQALAALPVVVDGDGTDLVVRVDPEAYAGGPALVPQLRAQVAAALGAS